MFPQKLNIIYIFKVNGAKPVLKLNRCTYSSEIIWNSNVDENISALNIIIQKEYYIKSKSNLFIIFGKSQSNFFYLVNYDLQEPALNIIILFYFYRNI